MSELIEMLREKTGEEDYKSFLKSSLGGYTKASVMEYINFLKGQQGSLKNAYSEELARIAAEKDSLLQQVQELTALEESAEDRYLQKERMLESELNSREMAFQESFAEREKELKVSFEQRENALKEKFEEREKALEDGLRKEFDALEKDMDEALSRIREDEEKIAAYEKKLKIAEELSEKSRMDYNAAKKTMENSGAEIDRLSAELKKLSAEKEALLQQNSIMRAELEKGEAIKLRAELETAKTACEEQERIGKLLKQELENRESRIEILSEEVKNQHQLAENLQKSLADCSEHLQWMECENSEMSRRLKLQMEESIDLSRECARVKASNGLLRSRLEQANLMRQLESQEDM